MQEVGHDLSVEAPIRLEEVMADGQVVDVLSIVELADGLVHLGDVPALVVEGLSAGEDVQQENLHFRQLLAELGDDRRDSIDDL